MSSDRDDRLVEGFGFARAGAGDDTKLDRHQTLGALATGASFALATWRATNHAAATSSIPSRATAISVPMLRRYGETSTGGGSTTSSKTASGIVDCPSRSAWGRGGGGAISAVMSPATTSSAVVGVDPVSGSE